MKSGVYTKLVPGTDTISQQWSWHTAGGAWIIAEPSLDVLSISDAKTGVYNPYWKKNRGKTVTNSAYHRTTLERSAESVVVTGKRYAYYFYNGNLYGGYHECVMNGNPTIYEAGDDVTVETVDYTSADNLAKLKLSKKIVDEYRKVSGGTFLREFRETIKMIRKPSRELFDRVGQYLTTVRKRSNKTSKFRLDKRSEMVRDTYLEATLGWLPLMGDIEDIAKLAGELAIRGERDAEGLRSISSGQFAANAATVSNYSLQFPTPNLGSHPMNMMQERTERVTVQYTAQCSREALYPKNDLQAIVQLSGFSLREWVPTLWNCIPYSFIIDYFTNLGDVIEFYAADRSSIAGLTRSVKRETLISQKYRLDYTEPSSEWEVNFDTRDLGSVRKRRVDFERTLVDPVLLDVKFQWENPLPNPKKFFNMVGLASSIYHTNISLRN